MAGDEDFPDIQDTDTTCPECYAEFLEPEDLELHIKQVHKPTGLRCQFCSKSHKSIEDYALHIIDKHLVTLRNCSYCHRIFTDTEDVRKHEKKHKTFKYKKCFACSVCDEIFENVYELQEHEKTYHYGSFEGVFLNDSLPVISSFLNIKALSFIESFGKDINYMCTSCYFASQSPIEYIGHLRKKKCVSVVCNKCCNVYREKKGLVRHLQKHKECHINYNDDEIKKTCKKCDKTFNIFTYNDHTRNCNAISCNMCGVNLDSMYELSRHQTNDHPMAITMKICSFCRREFVGQVALQKHIDRTHRLEFPLYKYSCVYCEQLYFKHPKNLFGHFFSQHNDLKPYSCKICDMSFRPRKKFTLHIKLAHKSDGFVEFDENFHVFFTDQKSEKPFVPTSFFADQIEEDKSKANETDVDQILPTDVGTDAPTDAEETVKRVGKTLPKIRFKEEAKEKSLQNKDIPSTIDGNVTEGAKPGTKRNLKRSTKVKSKAVKKNNSDDSDDEPLNKKRKKPRKVVNRSKIPLSVKEKKKQFTCYVCKKYCYTFQNYNHHMSLHFKDEVKKCIKCSREFPSKLALNNHINEKHSTSQLTETLKSLLMRRKSGIVTSELSTAERFRKTIKKVTYNPQPVKATIKTSENLSVQKFIESFTPEETGTAKKAPEIQTSVSVTVVNKTVNKPPAIKLNKFKPKPFPTTAKLAMPVHFKDLSTDKPKLNIKVIQNSAYEDDYSQYDHEEDIMHDEDEAASDKNDTVPEVAQEVMLGETQEVRPPPPILPHKIIIPKLPKEVTNQDIRIAHLAPEAPYFKIVKMKDIIKESKAKVKAEQEKDEEIKLPFGTRLVNVNPLAHLIGDTPVEKIVGTGNKYYQKKKTENFERAIAKALLKLETPVVRKRPPKKKKKGEETDDLTMTTTDELVDEVLENELIE